MHCPKSLSTTIPNTRKMIEVQFREIQRNTALYMKRVPKKSVSLIRECGVSSVSTDIGLL